MPIKPQQFIHMIDTFRNNEKNDNRGIQTMIMDAVNELEKILDTNNGAPTKVSILEKADLSDRGSKVFEAFLLMAMTPVRVILTLAETVVAPHKLKETYGRFFEAIGGIPNALNVAVSGRIPKEYGSRTNAEIKEWIKELKELNSSMQGLGDESAKRDLVADLIKTNTNELSKAYEAKLNQAQRILGKDQPPSPETPNVDVPKMTEKEAQKFIKRARAAGNIPYTKESSEADASNSSIIKRPSNKLLINLLPTSLLANPVNSTALQDEFEKTKTAPKDLNSSPKI